MIEHRGFRPEEIMEVINSREGGSEVLRGMVEDAISSSGIKGWNNADVLERAYGYAEQGLWSAVGKEERKQVSNKGYDYAMQNWLAKEKEKRDEERLKRQQTTQLAINPLNIYSKKEQDAAAKQIAKYSKYFTKDEHGNTVLSEEGRKEYERNATSKFTTKPSDNRDLLSPETMFFVNYDGDGAFTPSDFKTFIDSVKIDGKGALNYSDNVTIGQVWDHYLKSNNTSTYDTTKVTEYDYTIKPSDQEFWGQQMLTALGSGDFKAVDYDSKTKTFKPTGDTLSKEDFIKGKAKVVSTRISPYGNTVMIQDSKGNTVRYSLPKGINTTNENNRDKAMAAANAWQKVVTTGQYTDANGNVRQATPDEITYAQQMYNQSTQQAYMYHSQLGGQNTTEKQQFHPYGY